MLHTVKKQRCKLADGDVSNYFKRAQKYPAYSLYMLRKRYANVEHAR